MDIGEAIQSSYVFRNLEAHQLQAVKNAAIMRSFHGGDTLMRQFEKNYDLMIILEGAARITTYSGETIAEVSTGSLIGEMALIDDQPRSATVLAVGETKVAVLPYDSLKQILTGDHQLAYNVILNISKVLVQRLRTTNLQLDAALTKLS